MWIVLVSPGLSDELTVVAVTGTFKPAVHDRIDLIQEHIKPLIEPVDQDYYLNGMELVVKGESGHSARLQNYAWVLSI